MTNERNEMILAIKKHCGAIDTTILFGEKKELFHCIRRRDGWIVWTKDRDYLFFWDDDFKTIESLSDCILEQLFFVLLKKITLANSPA